ncbi:MAG: PaaI family thioesterase [Pseudomonadota bacterium]
MNQLELPPPPADYDPLAVEPPTPIFKTLGIRLTAWSQGYASAVMPLSPDYANRHGMPHGGVLMTLMDAVGGYAGCWCAYPGRLRRAMTLSMNTSFLGVASGAVLTTEARVTGGGRSLFFTEMTVHDEGGRLAARASGTYRYRSASQTPYGEPVEGGRA